ncbi:MAG: PP2C family serine/threonine-protein phosphatase [Alphaproteobacteria bacterium]|nr:PP2C family serine/threonine-protein phosphatase [Alphaproteobacteria bacterium]
MSWMAALDYRQGTAHRAAGIPCQDFGRLVQLDEDTVIAALADGAGSARFSHIGARAAVDCALPWLRERLINNRGSRGRLSTLPAATLFDGLVQTVQAKLTQTANDNRHDLRDYACTLALVALSPNEVSAAQIGDGLIVARQVQGDYTLLIAPDHGEYINETSFITDPDAQDHMRISSMQGPIRFVGAATDGLAGVSIDNRKNSPHAPFFAPMDSFARQSTCPGDVHNGIRDFLASKRLAEKSADDLSLMLCGWQGYDSA